MTNPTTDAYAAGLLDGEGCIGLSVSPSTYGVRVDIGMTTKAAAVLRTMQREYGGIVAKTRDATEKWEEATAWRVFGPEASAYLRRVQPYVRLKPEQVRLALLVEDIRLALSKTPTGRSRWTDEARERCRLIWLRIKELNRKGPAAPSPTGEPLAQLVAGKWLTTQSDLFSDLGWEPFSGTWPAWGMTRDGFVYEQPMPALPTTEPASSSLLPTPTVSDANGVGAHGDGGADLRTTVSLFPTPVSRDWKGPTGSGYNTTSLPDALLPTPRATDGTKGRPNQRGSSGDLMLPSAVQLLPTPSAADGMGGHLSRSGDRSDELLLPGVAKSLALPTPRATRGGSATETVYLLDSGGLTRKPSPDGSESSDALLPDQLSLDVTEPND